MATALYVTVGVAVLIALSVALYKRLKVFLRFRGTMLVTCPENQKPAGVAVDAAFAARTTTARAPQLRLKECTRWPERENCGQECLQQVEASPESCLVRILLTDWYRNKKCVYCHKEFGDIFWHDHKPVLLNAECKTVEWQEVPVETLPEVFETHLPVCWNCHIAETFRREHPDLVTDRPQ
ncbi:MAG: hypothetical protein ACE5IR_23390 [bacterium]